MTVKSIKILTEDRDYWKKLCSELSDRNFELEEQKEWFRRNIVDMKAVEVILRKENKRMREALERIAREALEHSDSKKTTTAQRLVQHLNANAKHYYAQIITSESSEEAE